MASLNMQANSPTEKKSAKTLIGKTVVSKGGMKFGECADILFEVQNGELMNIVIKAPTSYTQSLGLERNKDGHVLVPFHAVIATHDFIVVNEEEVF